MAHAEARIYTDTELWQQVVGFWRAEGDAQWFSKDPDFDRRFRERFLALHERAAAGEFEHWLAQAESALALMILLDQFPRNAFRGTPRMYATDPLAYRYADRAVKAGLDQQVEQAVRLFFYLPFAHSERLEDQERSVALIETIGNPAKAEGHRAIIRRFGRFPHRNPILGRDMKPEEQAFLDQGGFSG